MEQRVKNILGEKLEISPVVEKKLLETYEIIRIKEKEKAGKQKENSEIQNGEISRKISSEKRRRKAEKILWRTGFAAAAVFIISCGAVFAYDVLRKPELLSNWMQEMGIK